ncbi:MAG: hypothetical protein ACXW1D_00065 [Halobacteriota archaeon]
MSHYDESYEDVDRELRERSEEKYLQQVSRIVLSDLDNEETNIALAVLKAQRMGLL